uniref:Secreted protein n=1 Tax=Proboscia inermis TaxID=420281 RepID=A0A7S0CG79_9STRA|mmetsp:Transcript_44909/g.45329  ORF Transcript_44909/g.45329 Transcript_44909/m.45329 type:complete len:247 (+) Transcript_44909:71-811(+)
MSLCFCVCCTQLVLYTSINLASGQSRFNAPSHAFPNPVSPLHIKFPQRLQTHQHNILTRARLGQIPAHQFHPHPQPFLRYSTPIPPNLQNEAFHITVIDLHWSHKRAIHNPAPVGNIHHFPGGGEHFILQFLLPVFEMLMETMPHVPSNLFPGHGIDPPQLTERVRCQTLPDNHRHGAQHREQPYLYIVHRTHTPLIRLLLLRQFCQWNHHGFSGDQIWTSLPLISTPHFFNTLRSSNASVSHHEI